MPKSKQDFALSRSVPDVPNFFARIAPCLQESEQESPANAKGTRDSSASMKAHCEQM